MAAALLGTMRLELRKRVVTALVDLVDPALLDHLDDQQHGALGRERELKLLCRRADGRPIRVALDELSQGQSRVANQETSAARCLRGSCLSIEAFW